ncbi:PepSY domain-containing protein [Streptomyces spiramenti]|uniref:PepSY domain-containing protein n=1 Tax=Streptomyces spiramenti TaxID=2720606 RepID=A0ABX1AF63_9ACTN|nr:PepSY domain-containing protein [Streptomyces spiramenti]NJP65842.1 hypothetical protein [Streptomyces spiramenti]
MKRSTVVAAIAVAAVIGGGTVAGAAMSSGGSEPSAAAQELRAESSSQENPSPGGTTATDDRDDQDDDRDDTGKGAGSDAAGSPEPAATGVADQVIRTALEAVPGHVVELDLDRDDKHWDVEVAGEDDREHELEISLDGGKVLHHEQDRDDDAREKVKVLSGGSVSAADAVRIAEEHVAGQVKDLDLDKDDRVWDVELRAEDGSEWELEIDLNSGDVRNVERDDDRDDD